MTEDNSAPLKGSSMAAEPSARSASHRQPCHYVRHICVAMVVMYAVNATGTLRVSKEGELYGLDLHEHGISAYPEYVIFCARCSGWTCEQHQKEPSMVAKPVPSFALKKTAGSL